MLKHKKIQEYPDLLDITEMCEILRISIKTGYKLLRNNSIACIKIGNKYRVPKCNVVDYIQSKGVV